MEISIKAIDLTKKFGNFTAVDHINFEVYKNEIFAFLGPNGAGKTTTIKMLTTTLEPTEGTAIVEGYDIRKEPAKIRRIISVVPQEYTADEDLTGWENLMLIAALYGIPKKEAKERAEDLLKMLDLYNAKDRIVDKYSGGMRRRLEIAMGLINLPKILFLDEPTLGLDVQTRSYIWDYIKDLKKEYNVTIFFTTHYLEEADKYADRIAIIDHGKILKIGKPDELKKEVGEYVIYLKVDNTEKAKEILSKFNEIKEIKVDNDELIITAEKGNEILPEILKSLEDIKIKSVEMKEPDIDEVFMKYTGRKIREEEAGSEEVFRLRRTMRVARR